MSDKVISVHRGSTIRQATKLMVESDQVFLPVVDDNNKLVGAVTEKMLIKWFANAKDKAKPVSCCMKSNVMSFEQNTGLIVVVYRFIREDLRQMPVTLNGRLVGIVKRGGVIQHLMQLKTKTDIPV